MPKKSNKYKRIADLEAQAVSDEKLSVSFEYIDWETEEFFFHGMEVKYYQKFFACICKINQCREREILEQTHPSLSPKSIFNSDSSIKNSFPESVISRIKDKLSRSQRLFNRREKNGLNEWKVSLNSMT